MATITTINAGDQITSSRADINTNFANLNSDKVEISVIDTDTTLTANSDSKIPTQKAVKAYVDAGGNVNASTTNKGIVEEATQAEVDAGTAAGGTGARLFVNPSTLSRYGVKNCTAGGTINGATLPVPVYQNKTDNEFYACDGNDTAAMKFLGFAISNGTDGGAMTVQFSGIVSGFTGLDEGEKYYLSDTVGTIANAPGTYEVMVGVAISTTELLIQKGRRRAAGSFTFTPSDAGSSQTITCGFRPAVVRLVVAGGISGTSADRFLFSVYANGSLESVSVSGGGLVDTTDELQENATDENTFSVTTITDTTFKIEWTNDSVNAVNIGAVLWEAEGEL